MTKIHRLLVDIKKVLIDAEVAFNYYAKHHEAKGTKDAIDKAERNKKYANRQRTALKLLSCLENEIVWNTTPPPKNRDFYIRSGAIQPCKWKEYKPQAQKQLKKKGRWMVMNEYGGWVNLDDEPVYWKENTDFVQTLENISEAKQNEI